MLINAEFCFPPCFFFFQNSFLCDGSKKGPGAENLEVSFSVNVKSKSA